MSGLYLPIKGYVGEDAALLCLVLSLNAFHYFFVTKRNKGKSIITENARFSALVRILSAS